MTDEIVYNNDKDVNDQWYGEVAGQPISGQIVERINRNNLEHVTKIGCKHSRTSRRSAEDIPGAIEVTCEECPIGWFESQA